MDIQRFIGTRVRLQRLGDGKFFTGWLQDLTPSNCRVDCKESERLAGGDEFLVQVFGNGYTAIFKTVLNATGDNQVILDMHGNVRVLEANEQARIAVSDVKAMVRVGHESFETNVLDVSVGGVGIHSDRAIERGLQIEIAMDSPHGPVAAIGTVRYCRTDPECPPLHRVGIQLETMSRVDGARWRRMFEADAA